MRLLLPICLLACKVAMPTDTDDIEPLDTDPPIVTGFCADLAVGDAPICAEQVEDGATLDSFDSDGVVWLVPLDSDIPPVVLSGSQTDLLGFLQQAMPNGASLDQAGVDALIHGPGRVFSSGRLRRRSDVVVFSFDQGDTWQASYRDVKDSYNVLQDLVVAEARFGVDLRFDPDANQAEQVLWWRPKFGVEGIDVDPDYVAYAEHTAVGRLRILDRAQFEQGREEAQWGVEDILVLIDAEGDFERVIAGVVSEEPMARFSRAVQRSQHRGTPACYLRDAATVFSGHADQLVRLTCGASGATIETATQAEADTFQAGLQATPVHVIDPDYGPVDIVPLADLDLSDALLRDAAIAQYGLSNTRLAASYRQVPVNLVRRGVAVPVAFYQDFLERNTWYTDIGQGPVSLTYQETLDLWLNDPVFLNDATVRRGRLEALSGAMRTAQVDPLLIERLGDQLTTVFGSRVASLHVRPSLNIEDQAVLPFADLLDSAIGCPADDLDEGPLGPSRCESSYPGERSMARAVAEVYASVWSFAAHEQRVFHGMDAQRIASGLLITDRVAGEQAGAVVRTDASGASLVAVQPGSVAAVGRANQYPELFEVPSIRRIQGSSEVSRGQQVLTDAEIRSLSEHLDRIGAPSGSNRFSEWKLLASGQWALTSVQPVE